MATRLRAKRRRQNSRIYAHITHAERVIIHTHIYWAAAEKCIFISILRERELESRDGDDTTDINDTNDTGEI